MEISELGLAAGTWLAGNCGKFPSEQNCKLVMMAPEGQRADLLDAAVAHAVKNHGHEESAELRQQLDQLFSRVEV